MRPHITVRVYNYAAATRADVAEMEIAVTRIFEVSGIGTRWIQCTPILGEDPALSECRSGADHTTIPLLLVTNVSPARGDILGSTVDGTSAIWVGYKLGRAMQRNFPYLSCGRILGHVAAHEIGHVFLGTNAHSVAGIMRARFLSCDFLNMARGHLLFLPQQSRLLRSKILSFSPATE